MDQFLLFGDSITQQSFSQDLGFGFGAALSHAYVRSLDVVNRGFSGYNTRLALRVLPKIVPLPANTRLRFMTIWFGANDARLKDTPGGTQQHIPLDEYRKNIRAMVTHPSILAHEGVRLILITPPPVDERMCLEHDRAISPELGDNPRRVASVTAQYAQAIRDLGDELGIAVLDVWSAMVLHATGSTENQGRPTPGGLDSPRNVILQSFLRDGLHFSSTGYRIMFEEMQNLIKETWPDQTPARLRYVFPAWDDEKAWELYNAQVRRP